MPLTKVENHYYFVINFLKIWVVGLGLDFIMPNFDIASKASQNSSFKDESPFSSDNPYLTRSVKQSNWDAIFQSMGFMTPYQRAEAERLQNAKNWESERKLQLEQREYDDPANQVARMKNAGLNPNMSPDSISPGSSGDAPGMASTSDMSDVFGPMASAPMDIAGVVTSVVGLMTGTAEAVSTIGLGIRKTIAETDRMDLDVTSGISTFAKEYANSYAGIKDLLESNPDADDFGILLEPAIKEAKKKPYFRSKRNQDRFDRFLREYWNSAEHKSAISKIFKEASENSTSAKKAQVEEKAFNSSIKQVIQATNESIKIYYENLPRLEAARASAEYEDLTLEEAQSKRKKAMLDNYEEIIKPIQELIEKWSDDPNIFKVIGVTGLSYVESVISNNILD